MNLGNPFKYTNDPAKANIGHSEGHNDAATNAWAINTKIVAEHIRRHIPEYEGHCSRRRTRGRGSHRARGRLAGLGRHHERASDMEHACLGIMSEEALRSRGDDGLDVGLDDGRRYSDVVDRARYIAALIEQLQRADGDHPLLLELSCDDAATSVHRTSVESGLSLCPPSADAALANEDDLINGPHPTSTPRNHSPTTYPGLAGDNNFFNIDGNSLEELHIDTVDKVNFSSHPVTPLRIDINLKKLSQRPKSHI